MKRLATAILVIAIASSFSGEKTLQGTWEYQGGVRNGKIEDPPTGYRLERIYLGDSHFTTYALENGNKPKIYETGNYNVKADTCIETQTYGIQPTGLKNIPVHYLFTIRNDSLILKGKSPAGVIVEEYWKRVPEAPPPY